MDAGELRQVLQGLLDLELLATEWIRNFIDIQTKWQNITDIAYTLLAGIQTVVEQSKTHLSRSNALQSLTWFCKKTIEVASIGLITV